MEEVQSWWEIPAIAHFCNVFRAYFNLLYFDVGELEAAILDMQDPEMSISLEQLIIKFLEACFNQGEVTNLNWEEKLVEALEKFDENESFENPLNGVSFHSLSSRLKVEILFKLCQIRLDVAAAEDAIKDIPAEDMQAVCIGQDCEKYSYWYFGDERLYKESLFNASGKASGKRQNAKNKKKTFAHENRKLWKIVCHNLNDWETLVQTFSKSKSTLEKELAKEIKNDYLDKVEKTIAEKERLLRKRYLELAPKRTSSRISKIQAQRKLEEQKAAAEEERRMEEYNREQAKRNALKKEQEIEEREKRAQKRNKIIEERAKRAQQRGMLRNFIDDYGSSNDSFDKTVIKSRENRGVTGSKSNESDSRSDKSDFSESENESQNDSETDSNNVSENDSKNESGNDSNDKSEKSSNSESENESDNEAQNDNDSQSDNESNKSFQNVRNGDIESTNHIKGNHFRQKELVHYDLTQWNSNINSKKEKKCVLNASSSNASDQKRLRLNEDGNYKVATINGLNSSFHKGNNSYTHYHMKNLNTCNVSLYKLPVRKSVVRIDFLKAKSKQISS